MTLIGRNDAIARLAGSQAKLAVVFGDSGVGKTTVLGAAQLEAQGVNTIAPDPIPLRTAPGALQRGLLEALGLAVAQITVDTSAAERLGKAVKRAIGGMAEERLKGLAKAVGRHFLSVVRAHIGDDAVDAVERVALELATPEDAVLQARIVNSADSDVIDLVAELGRAALDLAEDRDILLTLDNADRLGEDDVRRLADLASHLPERLRLQVGFSTWGPDARNNVDRLREAGAQGIELVGLTTDDVALYLAQRGLSEQLAGRVHAVTNGYPLYLEDAGELLLQHGGDAATLNRLGPGEVLTARTKLSWRTLDAPTQTAAMLLAAFNSPLAAEVIPGYLGASTAAWATIEARLRDAGIFTGQHRLWFHELRRRCLWDEVLTPAQRETSADKALPYLAGEIAVSRLLPERLVEYARLAPTSAATLGRPKVAEVMAASRDEVALVAAAIELAETQHRQETPNAEHVILHAKDAFNVGGDLRAALRAAIDRRLLISASNQHVMIVAPKLDSDEATMVLAGRATDELGRTPVPSAATRLFEGGLRPRLEPFRTATIGVGRPSVAELSQMAEHLQQRHADGSYHIGPQGPNLLVRARHGGLPMYVSLAFDSAEARDKAFHELKGLNEPFFGLPLRCELVLEHPLDVVPSLRFVLAVERILGRRLRPMSLASETLEQPIDVEAEAIWRVDFVEAIRALCSPEERFAYELEESRGVLFHGDDAIGTALVEVLGGTGARRLARTPTLRAMFARIEVAVEAALADGERIGRMSLHTAGLSNRDPIVGELKDLHEKARAFNRTQRKPRFALTEESLAPALSAAAAVQLADARALRDVVMRHGRDVPPLRGVSRCILLQVGHMDLDFVPGAEAGMLSVRAPNDLDHDEVVVRIVDRLPKWSNSEERFALLEEVFGSRVDPRQSGGWSRGLARHELAESLGYDQSEVAFSYGYDDPAM